MSYPISIVSKKTGITKYLLRMWERRYSFPRPVRDENDERVYSRNDLEKLIRIKKLMDMGYRPSQVIEKNLSELKAMLKLPAIRGTKTDKEIRHLKILIVSAKSFVEKEQETSYLAKTWMNLTKDIN